MTAFKQVDFTIDFAGSTNFTLIDPATKKKAKEQKIKVSVPPYERLLAAHVELHDYGSLKYSIAARAAQVTGRHDCHHHAIHHHLHLCILQHHHLLRVLCVHQGLLQLHLHQVSFWGPN